MSRSTLDFEKCLASPERVFGSPERIVADARLDRRAKLQILRKWEEHILNDGSEAGETAHGVGANILGRVRHALSMLSDEDG